MRDHGLPELAFDRQQASCTDLGATADAEGTNFALYSGHATAVELVLFDETGRIELFSSPLPEMEGGIWHGYLPGVKAGQLYGYRVHGPYAPEEGHRFNPNKLLLDPYAQTLRGNLIWDDALFGYQIGQDDLSFDERDSAPFVPKAVVTDHRDDLTAAAPLGRAWEETVIYEAHVRGLTMRHPGVAVADRGTFAGLASAPVLDHLRQIGITAIELLPVQGFVHDRHLLRRGQRNYWGYNTLSFFAPYSGYLRSGRIGEMQEAVRRFHDAGIEVILDVVYNHTAEGNELGPTLSFRGIDNAAYYVLDQNRRHCFDVTGTGNSVNVIHPMVLRMVLDSLRYWVRVMQVDGFRFDLAPTLGREAGGFERDGAFFAAVRQDPVLSGVKLIAEPWDIGDSGYRVGGFPWPFREWNDKARDDIRRFWRKDPAMAGRLSQRLAGSPRQFDHTQRPATSSVNFIAAHDGFTLWDTLSYNTRHNEANGEDGQDGHPENFSDNMGAEGPTDDPQITAARMRRARAMLATLFLSQGVPMLLAGDEFGQSQGGNNNVYCQDNETAWLDWQAARPELIAAVADLAAFRAERGGLACGRFARAEGAAEEDEPRLDWLHPRGGPMEDSDWQDEALRVFGLRMQLPNGRQMVVLLNAGEDCSFALPPGRWRLVLDTARTPLRCNLPCGPKVKLGWQTVAVLEPAGAEIGRNKPDG